jgi:hypothetical protein
MGLFKNGVLIDIIGTFNGGSSNLQLKDRQKKTKYFCSKMQLSNETAEMGCIFKDTLMWYWKPFIGIPFH